MLQKAERTDTSQSNTLTFLAFFLLPAIGELQVHGCHQLRGTEFTKLRFLPPPHPTLHRLDVSGCSALHLGGLLRILKMVPMVRHLDVSYTPLTTTASGRGALYTMAEQRLRTGKPIIL